MDEWIKAAAILIVDDNPTNVRILERLLSANGFTNVTSTTDPYEGLELHESLSPDLLLLDLHMPTLDGYSVMDRVRKRLTSDAYFPVLVLTADATSEAKLRALSEGAEDFLTKPFDHSEVLLRVCNLLKTRYLYVQLGLNNLRLETRVEERTRDLEEARVEVIDRLALAAEFRDDDTHQHTQRVAETCAAVARSLGLNPSYIEMLKRAAPLHDVGKIGISDTILLKPGKLTDEEFENMKTHTTIGAQILSGSKVGFLMLAEEIAVSHHERWEGKGYPQGLAGDAIPLSGRIVAVADVFDALTSDRPYKQAWSLEKALGEMESMKGRHFDPDVFDAFISNFRQGDWPKVAPIGSTLG